ncbi:MAG: hypothetical protein JXB45_00655 [Candidatus Krumholzibacteriota bacterium]|nr:hypothetical protein [Candidatus Krumholzibacteriota bacterium]
MKRSILIMTIILTVLAMAAQGDIPRLINYQGVLTDPAGEAVPNGEYQITFRLYQAVTGGSPLWSEIQTVTVSHGIFNALLGSVTALDIGFAEPYYLGIAVENQAELSPRLPLVSSAYSLRAGNAEKLQDLDAGAFADSAHHHDTRYCPRDELSGESIINQSGNPVDWTSLKNVPSGFADGTDDTGGEGELVLPYQQSVAVSVSAFHVVNTGSGPGLRGEAAGDSAYGIYACATGIAGTGIYARGGTDGWAGVFRGNIQIQDHETGEPVLEMGEGLDYAEGFNLSGEGKIEPGAVLIIDPENPGKLTLSKEPYDNRVAGIVAGAGGLGSGVRLGVDRYDCDVALAGRVYCNVDASEHGVEPGDLLTTSGLPGYAMKVTDPISAPGAVLGKAMERLEKGEMGQILVLVTLQ